MKKRRELTVIAEEIRIALKSETANILKLGELLVEAKNSRHIKHGQWLPWLTQNFSMCERTAQKYMGAYRLAAKYESDADFTQLKLSAGALYFLSTSKESRLLKSLVTHEAIVAILKEAETKWVDEDRAYIISEKVAVEQSKTKAAKETEAAKEAADLAEAESFLDNPPPEVSPPNVEPEAKPSSPEVEPEPAPTSLERDEFFIGKFKQIINDELHELTTKPAAMFRDHVAREDLLTTIDFLKMVAGASSASSRAAALAQLATGDKLTLEDVLASKVEPVDLIALAKELEDLAAKLKRKTAA